MKVKGRTSCTGNYRHINITYFFVKDRVDSGEVKIMYCPTGRMLVDCFTKPLQGNLFKKFRAVIMSWEDISTLVKCNMKSSKVRSVLVNVFYHIYSLLFLTNSWTDDEEVRIYKYIQQGRKI